MGRRQAFCFRPGLDLLEVRQVLSASASNPIVHTAIAPVAVPIATYNNTFTQISNAFYDYEAPADDVLNAIGSAASSVASAVLSSGSTFDASSDGSYVQDSKGDPNALQSRLQAALSPLPGGQTEANALINRTFAYGGLNTDDAPYFQAKLTSMVKKYLTQEIHRGDMVLVWPGEAVPGHRS
jgi:hypothetical protein